MKIEQAQLDQLKQRYPAGIFEGTITFTDDEDVAHEIVFVYRKPTTIDVEMYSKTAQKNVMTANLNLIQSLIVYPEPAPVIAEIRDYPAAYGRFVDEAVMPFFGANVTVKKQRL
jgi:hypothetical protein